MAPRLTQDLSVFAVFDGHGGHGCADFLKEYMPMFIQRQDALLRQEPEAALKRAFLDAEEEFMKKNEQIIKDRSGSCACLVLIQHDQIYVANVGDSRAIMSL